MEETNRSHKISLISLTVYFVHSKEWSVVALCLALVVAAAAAPAQLCAGAAEDDPRAARFCQALNTFLELYAEAAGEQVPEYQGNTYLLTILQKRKEKGVR